MFLATYAEKAGNGILDMLARCRKAGLRRVELREDGGQFVQTLWRPRPVATEQVTPQVCEQVTVLAQNVLDEVSSAFSRATGQVTGQVAVQVMNACQTPRSGGDIQTLIGIKHRETFLNNYLGPLLTSGWIERTIPNKPTSRLQKYRLTAVYSASPAIRTVRQFRFSEELVYTFLLASSIQPPPMSSSPE